MKLSPSLQKAYTEDRLFSHEAQLRAQFIAWGPAVFQATRIMLKRGVLEALRDSADGLTRAELCARTGLGDYAMK